MRDGLGQQGVDGHQDGGRERGIVSSPPTDDPTGAATLGRGIRSYTVARMMVFSSVFSHRARTTSNRSTACSNNVRRQKNGWRRIGSTGRADGCDPGVGTSGTPTSPHSLPLPGRGARPRDHVCIYTVPRSPPSLPASGRHRRRTDPERCASTPVRTRAPGPCQGGGGRGRGAPPPRGAAALSVSALQHRHRPGRARPGVADGGRGIRSQPRAVAASHREDVLHQLGPVPDSNQPRQGGCLIRAPSVGGSRSGFHTPCDTGGVAGNRCGGRNGSTAIGGRTGSTMRVGQSNTSCTTSVARNSTAMVAVRLFLGCGAHTRRVVPMHDLVWLLHHMQTPAATIRRMGAGHNGHSNWATAAPSW